MHHLPPTFLPSKSSCLVFASIAVKRQHDHNNSYKGKHLMEADLRVQRFSPLSSWQDVWQLAGRHDAGEWIRVLHVYHLQARGRERSWNWLQTFIQFISVSFSFSEMAFRTQILHSYVFSFTFLLPFLKVDLLSVCLLIIEHYKLNYNASNIAKFRKLKTEAWTIELKIQLLCVVRGTLTSF